MTRFVDRTDIPAEIDGHRVIIDKEAGTVLVERDLIDQAQINLQFLPVTCYLIEKWGFASVVSGCCQDEAFLRNQELPLWHTYDIEDLYIMECFKDLLDYKVLESHPKGGVGMATPVNPYTREIIWTLEEAEALDLSDYDPGVEVVAMYDDERFNDILPYLQRVGYTRQADLPKYFD